MAILRDSGNSHVVWSGTLPPRNCRTNSPFSCKVFLGGVPWDITETDLQKTFGVFSPLRVEWPGVHDHSSTQRPKGHLYLLFEDERSVKKLLGVRCSYDVHHNQHNWFYRVASPRMLGKSALVSPWQLADATYALHGYVPTPGTPYRIFVANLHGMITAEGLGRIMNDLFGGVIAATLDTDKTEHPFESCRVTFNNPTGHLKAITAETLEIRTAKFTCQIKIDSYLEDAVCSTWGVQPGQYITKAARLAVVRGTVVGSFALLVMSALVDKLETREGAEEMVEEEAEKSEEEADEAAGQCLKRFAFN
ncbi:LOW QUALITY PROTEIN: cytoplasmic polyadenylation element-binding protein 1-like [Paramacrobiotus metropolitanus]|uniref:LOW QUALITY PROTEIN: cytoplasmic polyadenylation element-binding protein 1-like n=1 Tax=Paramacrobiotus metropolitanus TaxID=2943436 RepID=UPI0024456D92|nr:LOW QUALITY PROTEIN: cytoplasmic polyadenylation element-binding protein 1-like [Paramacrobiotus metropolitanus]